MDIAVKPPKRVMANDKIQADAKQAFTDVLGVDPSKFEAYVFSDDKGERCLYWRNAMPISVGMHSPCLISQDDHSTLVLSGEPNTTRVVDLLLC